MKFRETESGNFKLTLTPHEADVFASIFTHVRLGVSGNSEVVLDYLLAVEQYLEPSINISFTYEESEGHIINV